MGDFTFWLSLLLSFTLSETLSWMLKSGLRADFNFGLSLYLGYTFRLKLSLRLSLSQNFGLRPEFQLSECLSEITLLFDLSLDLDQTLAQRKAQQKAKSKSEVTHRVMSKLRGTCWFFVIQYRAIAEIMCLQNVLLFYKSDHYWHCNMCMRMCIQLFLGGNLVCYFSWNSAVTAVPVADSCA